VLAHVDDNENGQVDSGDLTACEALVIGSGQDVTFSTLTAK
jgi:hypothetical protein